MFGEIGAWYYKALVGIKPDPQHTGFRNILLEPHFVCGLNQVYASHDGPYGKIVSSWERVGLNIEYHVVIPANSTATLTVKGKRILENGKNLLDNRFVQILHEHDDSKVLNLKSGSYWFTINQK